MKTPINLKAGLIIRGDPKHTHLEKIEKHDIGICSCGRMIDYTILQRQLPEMRDGHMERCFNMTQVTKTRTGDLKAIKEKPKKRRIA